MRRLNWSVQRILGLLYPFPGIITIADRNILIRQRLEEGKSIADIAVDFNISPRMCGRSCEEKLLAKADSRYAG
jgi:hypothetical protein